MMCGLDAYGLNTVYSSLFVVLQQLGTGLGKPNDGLVSFGSCNVKDQSLFQKVSLFDNLFILELRMRLIVEKNNAFIVND